MPLFSCTALYRCPASGVETSSSGQSRGAQGGAAPAAAALLCCLLRGARALESQAGTCRTGQGTRVMEEMAWSQHQLLLTLSALLSPDSEKSLKVCGQQGWGIAQEETTLVFFLCIPSKNVLSCPQLQRTMPAVVTRVFPRCCLFAKTFFNCWLHKGSRL